VTHGRRRLVLLAAALVWTFTDVPSATSPAGTIPERLSDAAFWRLIEESSEPDGTFPSDNFVSNELTHQSVLPLLTKRLPPGDVYIGVGPDQNFTYIAAIQPSIAFIVDIRRQNLIEHLVFKAVTELSSNRREFIARLFSRPVARSVSTSDLVILLAAVAKAPAEEALFQRNLHAVVERLVSHHRFALSRDDLDMVELVYRTFWQYGPEIAYSPVSLATPEAAWNETARPLFPTYAELVTETDEKGVVRSYLATDAAYARLRRMQQRNLIVPVVGDFAGHKTLRAIGRYVAERGATVSAFYTSNVEQYLFQDESWRSFYANVEALPLAPAATFIRAYFPRSYPRQLPAPRIPRILPQQSRPTNVRSVRLPSVTLLAPIADQLAAVRDERLQNYGDVIDLSE
jgi:hypothetical protein